MHLKILYLLSFDVKLHLCSKFGGLGFNYGKIRKFALVFLMDCSFLFRASLDNH